MNYNVYEIKPLSPKLLGTFLQLFAIDFNVVMVAFIDSEGKIGFRRTSEVTLKAA